MALWLVMLAPMAAATMTFLLLWLPSPAPLVSLAVSGLAVLLVLLATVVVASLLGAFSSVLMSWVLRMLVEREAPDSAPMPPRSVTEPSACSLEFLFWSSLLSMLSLVLLSPFFLEGSDRVTSPLAILLQKVSMSIRPWWNLVR